MKTECPRFLLAALLALTAPVLHAVEQVDLAVEPAVAGRDRPRAARSEAYYTLRLNGPGDAKPKIDREAVPPSVTGARSAN